MRPIIMTTILAAAILFVVAVCAFAESRASIETVRAHPERYAPPRCPMSGPCVVPDNQGGETFIWLRWAAENDGRRFIITGRCVSACWLALRGAAENGRVTFARGSMFGWGH